MNRFENKESKFIDFEKMFPPFLRDLSTDLCIPTIAEGWEWCFDRTKCYVLEKVDGTNVKLVVENGMMEVFARNQTTKGYANVRLNDAQYKHLYQGVVNAVAVKNDTFKDGTHFGEVIGKSFNGNPYQMDTNLWVTFKPNSNGVQRYTNYPETANFNEWKEWILNLKSLLNPSVEAEGVVFLNKETGQMAKLRKDMFDVKYQPVRRKRKK